MSRNPYAAALGAEDAQTVLTTTPARLNAVFEHFTEAEFEARPAPGKWSLREIMCHIADCEIAWAWRLRFAHESDRGTLQPFEQDPWANMYSHYTMAAARSTFDSLRAWNNAFIGGLTEADKSKPVLHPEHGEWTLWTIVEMMAGHDLHHLKALEHLGGSRGLKAPEQ